MKYSLVKIVEFVVPPKVIIFVWNAFDCLKKSLHVYYDSDSRFCHSGKRGPGNETLKKRKEQTAFYDRLQSSAGPGN